MMFTEIIMKNMLKIESLIHVYVLSAETTILQYFFGDKCYWHFCEWIIREYHLLVVCCM